MKPVMFVHIPKNGGMTIRKTPELRNKVLLASPQYHVSPDYTRSMNDTMQLYGEHHGNEHARWRDWHPQVRENLKAVAIVRNPWSRVVSRYEFARLVIYTQKKQPESYVDCTSFEAFLESRHEWGNKKYFWHRAIRGWYPALDHVIDESGKVRCDILRFENYADDVKQYFGTLTNPRARNRTGYDQSTYKSYYNDKTIQIVADWYKRDIDHWGFDFDTSATRNYWK